MIAVVYYLTDPFTVEWVMERLVFNVRNLGATHILAIDRTQYKTLDYFQNGDGQIQLEKFESMAGILAAYPGVPVVYLENEASLNKMGVSYSTLENFQHPEDAIYVVGPDFGGDITWGTETFVTIPCVENLWAEAALMIVLADRKAKGN